MSVFSGSGRGRRIVATTLCIAIAAGCSAANKAGSDTQAPAVVGPEASGMMPGTPGGVRGQGWEGAAGQWGDGKAIFEHTCALCHDTGVGPELRGRQLPADAITAIVRSGNGAMLAVRQSELSDAEVERVAKWIETSQATKAAGAKP